MKIKNENKKWMKTMVIVGRKWVQFDAKVLSGAWWNHNKY